MAEKCNTGGPDEWDGNAIPALVLCRWRDSRPRDTGRLKWTCRVRPIHPVLESSKDRALTVCERYIVRGALVSWKSSVISLSCRADLTVRIRAIDWKHKCNGSNWILGAVAKWGLSAPKENHNGQQSESSNQNSLSRVTYGVGRLMMALLGVK